MEEAVVAGAIAPERPQVVLQRMEERQAAGVQGLYGQQAGPGQTLRPGTCDGTRPHGPVAAGTGYGEPGEGRGPDQSHRYGR